MLPNHTEFLEAIRTHKLVRLAFYSLPDQGTVDRECAPLDYAPAASGTPQNRYWVWDPARTAGTNPLGLLSDQIVSCDVLGKHFDPASYPIAAALRAGAAGAGAPPPAPRASNSPS